MKRNAKGEVTIGKIKGTVPRDRSALAMIAINGMGNKWDFKSDGWVYIDGIKHKKWFSNYDGVKYWEPKLKNITTLEAQYTDWKDICRQFHIHKWQPAFDALKFAGMKGHCKPTHKFEGLHQWWEYDITEYPDLGYCYGFKWIDEPEILINHEIAQKFYHICQRSEQLYKRQHKTEIIFKLALDNYMTATYPVVHRNINELKFVKINGNEYLFIVKNRGNYVFWSLLSESQVEWVKIK
jgi:hypothetical protein